MKTDDLINMLASGPDVSAPAMPVQRFVLLVSFGFLASIGMMLTFLGMRPNLNELIMMPAFWIKIAFVVCLAAVGWVASARLSTPGTRITMLPLLIALPVLLIWIVGAISLMHAAPGERAQLFWGQTWRYCPFLIALLSMPLFVAVLKIMRNLAPVRLRLAGATAGFAAGAAATMVYSLHCPEIAAPFVGFWYLVGIMIPTVIGVLIGPRVLRW
ncbi:MAG TPA: DUF1109 domain-containing protein [Oxalicibacterium sp.]|uniref:DUF1109 domain-containing protein n=1 Tax=Oxalicibacterium sp. TaxID=2766525 RepID=UPI002CADC891|nr:DUF1109 domain-containing protein [Oxalicibacterium sp.]HWU98711.1 DUF1109 domain-containing protein [Oxalicibacterium sp.]